MRQAERHVLIVGEPRKALRKPRGLSFGGPPQAACCRCQIAPFSRNAAIRSAL
ncbi:hypothetical protein SAMN04244573_00945 [Azotobacter beijerinckii]|uniref:Uncharacterized protein n=1 Tax=Azotobacter beijerinckii TaxID=170623 RepID=A0A1H9D119_9GAMM|nr:hypothetical protein SAMN04244573_00945 [Azotobacter beijerinckii]